MGLISISTKFLPHLPGLKSGRAGGFYARPLSNLWLLFGFELWSVLRSFVCPSPRQYNGYPPPTCHWFPSILVPIVSGGVMGLISISTNFLPHLPGLKSQFESQRYKGG